MKKIFAFMFTFVSLLYAWEEYCYGGLIAKTEASRLQCYDPETKKFYPLYSYKEGLAAEVPDKSQYCYDGLVAETIASTLKCVDPATDEIYPLYSHKKTDKKVDSVSTLTMGIIRNDICNRPLKNSRRNILVEYNVSEAGLLTISGRCREGLKHGQFNYYLNNELFMKTKFNRNHEIKTDCVSNPRNRRISQIECVKLYSER